MLKWVHVVVFSAFFSGFFAMANTDTTNESGVTKLDNASEKTAQGCLAAREQQVAINRAYEVLIRLYVRYEKGFFIWNHKKYLADSKKLGQFFWKVLDPDLDAVSGFMLTRALEAEKLFPTDVKEARDRRKNLQHLMLGDSLMEYFKGYWHKNNRTPWEELTNLGIGGEKLENLRGRWNLYRLFFRPKHLTISIGGNNLLAGCRLVKNDNLEGFTTVQSLLDFLAQLQREMPQTKMVLINTPPTDFDFVNSSAVIWNQEIKKGTGFEVMDQYTYLADETGHRYSKYSINGDPIHINSLAYEQIWVPLLKQIYSAPVH